MSKIKPNPVIDIIDGHNWLNRAYYSSLKNKGMTLKDGTPTGAAKTFCVMLNALIRRRLASRGQVILAVVFDHKKGSDKRKKIMRDFMEKRLRGEDAAKLPEKYLSGYKGNRFSDGDDAKSIALRPQLKMIIDILTARGIHPITSVHGEADDIIGSLCFQLKCRKYIWSRDGDFAQLLKPDTRLRLPKQDNSEEQDITYQSCLEKYGVIPPMFVDLLALTGDQSDNIPGIPGVGDKTAIELLMQYEDLDSIFQAEHKGALGKKLKDPFYQDLCFMCRDLVEIKKDLKVDTRLSTYLLEPWSKKVERKVRSVEKQFEFKETFNC